MSEWTEELRDKVIEEYESANPTPENSMDIVTQLADKYDKTVNGVRIILSKAGVYIKKAPEASASKDKADSADKPKRVSKADAIASLVAAIEATGQTAESEIVDKLTGKAAAYFADVIKNISNQD